MSTESDTPRTDELSFLVQWSPNPESTPREIVDADDMRQLERELNEAIKQRDHYQKACDQYSEDEMLCKMHHVTKQRDDLKTTICDMMQLPSYDAYKLGKRALEKLTNETK